MLDIMEYPLELLPRKSKKCPIVDCNSIFVRLLKEFPYECLDDGDFLPKITDVILAPNGNIEIYSLSLYIYGTYNENHFNIVVSDKNYFKEWDNNEELDEIPFELEERFAIFLKTDLLKNRSISFSNDSYFINYEHKPTRSNFWHFELFVTKNGKEDRLPRKKGATREIIAEKIKEDILYFAASAAKDRFFQLYDSKISSYIRN